MIHIKRETLVPRWKVPISFFAFFRTGTQYLLTLVIPYENELLGGGFRKKGLLFVSRFGERKGNNTTSLFHFEVIKRHIPSLAKSVSSTPIFLAHGCFGIFLRISFFLRKRANGKNDGNNVIRKIRPLTTEFSHWTSISSSYKCISALFSIQRVAMECLTPIRIPNPILASNHSVHLLLAQTHYLSFF